MKKDLFLQLLKRKLDFLPAEAREAALEEYARRFAGVAPEEEDAFVRGLGTPAQIAETLRCRYMEAPGPARGSAAGSAPEKLPVLTAVGAPDAAPVQPAAYDPGPYAFGAQAYGAEQAFTPPGAAGRSGAGRVWLLVLCSPLWIALCAVLFALCMALLCVGVAVLLSGLALLAAGLTGATMALFHLLSPGQMLLFLGCGLLLAGLGLLIFWGGTALVAKGFPAAASGSCGLIGRIFKGGNQA